MTFEERILNIQHHAEHGPNHIRGVREAIEEALLQNSWGNESAAEYFVRQAENYCGVKHAEGQTK